MRSNRQLDTTLDGADYAPPEVISSSAAGRSAIAPSFERVCPSCGPGVGSMQTLYVTAGASTWTVTLGVIALLLLSGRFFFYR